MLTHDTGNCVLQNGGEEPHSDDDNDDDHQPMDAHNNHGVQIREINGDEDEAEENINELDDIDPDHNALEDLPFQSMYSNEDETTDPLECGKRKRYSPISSDDEGEGRKKWNW